MGKLYRILLISIAGLVMIAVVFHEDNPGIQMDRAGFRVNEGDALYFRNMRQFYYQKSVDERSGFDVYRLKAMDLDSASIALGFAIVNDWRNDQAYIMFEPTPGALSADTMHFNVQSGEEEWHMKLGQESMQRHLELAVEIYGWLDVKDASFSIHTEGGEMEIWASTQERDQVSRVLKDYFKLTGALR